MPYWNYHKVHAALDPSATRYYFYKCDQRLVADIAKLVSHTDITLGIDDLGVRSQIVDGLMAAILGGQPTPKPSVVQSLRNLTWDVCRGVYCQKLVSGILSHKSNLRFFLEPTITEALSTTSVKGLTTLDLPDIPVPFSVFLPEGTPQYLNADEFHSTITVDAIHIAAPVAGIDSNGCDALLYPLIVNNQARIADDDPVRSRGFAMGMLSLWPGRALPLEDFMDGGFKHIDPNSNGDVVLSRDDTTGSQIIVQRLVLNLLLYWKSEDPDILKQLNPEWEKIQAKVQRHVGGKKERAQAALKKTPRHEHYIVGQYLEVLQRREPEGADDKSESTPTGRKLRRHKRRGHWKWQPCGEQRSKRKLIFVETYTTRGQGEEIVEKIGFSVRS